MKNLIQQLLHEALIMEDNLNDENKIELNNLIKFLIKKNVFQEYDEPDNLENLRMLTHMI
jgi:hypothetical protein